MQTFRDIEEDENKALMRIAGVVRKEGWPSDCDCATLALQGPVFLNTKEQFSHIEDEQLQLFLDNFGYYSKQFVEEFMDWQEANFN